MNKWQERYKNGFKAYVEHSIQKEWNDCDQIPELDENGASDIVILFFKHMSNPIGMDTPEHIEAGFFHAQSRRYGSWHTLEAGNKKASGLIYWPDGWKQAARIEPEWVSIFNEAKSRIETGDCNF